MFCDSNGDCKWRRNSRSIGWPVFAMTSRKAFRSFSSRRCSLLTRTSHECTREPGPPRLRLSPFGQLVVHDPQVRRAELRGRCHRPSACTAPPNPVPHACRRDTLQRGLVQKCQLVGITRAEEVRQLFQHTDISGRWIHLPHSSDGRERGQSIRQSNGIPQPSGRRSKPTGETAVAVSFPLTRPAEVE